MGIAEQERIQELLVVSDIAVQDAVYWRKEAEKFEGLMRDARTAYHTVKGDLRIATSNLNTTTKDRGHLLILIEDMREQLNDLTEQLEDKIRLVNAPAAEALEEIWRYVFPSSYGEWEYPAQAARHVQAVFDELWQDIRKLRGNILLLEKNIWGTQRQAEEMVQELSEKYHTLQAQHQELEEYTKDIERELDNGGKDEEE